MPNRKIKSALMVAGVAAGAAAAASWFGKKKTPALRAVGSTGALEEPKRLGLSSARYSEIRDLSPVDTSRESMIEPESAELPIGRSADPAIDWALSRNRLSQDDTTGGALFTEPELRGRRSDVDLSLDDIWSSTPGIAEPEQSEGYDAVLPENLGAVWIERATQTTHEHRPHASSSSDVPSLEELVSQSSYAAAHSSDEGDDFSIEVDDDEIADDELDDDEPNERG